MKIILLKKAAAERSASALPRRVLLAAEKIFSQVVARGDEALFHYTVRFEHHRLTAKTVRVSRQEMEQARRAVPPPDLSVMRLAARRIKAYHRNQRSKGFRFDDGRGTVIEEQVRPLERVGICVPAGRFPLASTVLMTAIPARLAGVKKVVMISPWPEGRMNPHLLIAAEIAGVDEIYKIGGVQGVAALAAGTASVPRVEKIVGPGSVWVTAAKALAVSRGLCGIDGLAGPSEVVIVADDSANPQWVAADLLSQAEHGRDSSAVLITTSEKLARRVDQEIRWLCQKHRLPPADKNQNLRAFVVPDLSAAGRMVDAIAPEHLELMIRGARRFLKNISNAASIFIGPFSPVPAGDYLAGANHVLPTGGTARFSSPLGVGDFVKRRSVTTLSSSAIRRLNRPIVRFAEIEGLPAHGLAVRQRLNPGGKNTA